VNPALTPNDFDACLLSLERALVHARLACWDNNVEKATAIVDAFHNLPRLLLGPKPGWPTADWSVKGHNEMFLKPLLERYPDLQGLAVDIALPTDTNRT